MNKLIEISDVSKTVYKRVGWFKKSSEKLLSGISLTVEDGEFLAILGKNGSGKSTLLKCIAGMIYPDEGIIQINNKSSFHNRSSLMKEMGIFFGQKSLLFTDLNAIDYLKLLKKVYGLDDEEFQFMVDLVDKYMPCKDLLSKEVRGMSYGEKVKIEILSIVLHKPKLLILDEPFVGLDPSSQKNLLSFILEYRRLTQATVLLTTHQFLEVLEEVDRAIIINKGVITFDGQVDKLVESYYKRKILYIEWEANSSDFIIEDRVGLRVIKQTPFKTEIEIELDYYTVSEALNILLKLGDIRDFEVRTISIDKVVEGLYEEH